MKWRDAELFRGGGALMGRYEVELVLVRSVWVEVEARNAAQAREHAADRARWLSERGTRARLQLLCTMDPRRIRDAD